MTIPTAPDLTIIPNRGLFIAGHHMSDRQTNECRADWSHHGGEDVAPGAPFWTIALCNPAPDGTGTIHATLRVPRTVH